MLSQQLRGEPIALGVQSLESGAIGLKALRLAIGREAPDQREIAPLDLVVAGVLVDAEDEKGVGRWALRGAALRTRDADRRGPRRSWSWPPFRGLGAARRRRAAACRAGRRDSRWRPPVRAPARASRLRAAPLRAGVVARAVEIAVDRLRPSRSSAIARDPQISSMSASSANVIQFASFRVRATIS